MASTCSRSPGPDWHVPKRELILELQVAFETGRLFIDPNIGGVDTLVSELMAMRVRVGLSGYERFEAWREGTHDDLVLAWWEMNRKMLLATSFGPFRKLNLAPFC